MSDAPLELLTGRVFLELAAAVRAASPRIVDRWICATRQALPKADDMTFAQLRDNLPVVMEQMARALESDRAPETRFVEELSAEHGAQRFALNVNLTELLQEYILLRPVFFREVTTSLRRSATSDEINAINVGLDLSVRKAVVTFVEHQDRQLQAANEAQSKYLSFLSHDLRGGLNGAFLMIEVLKRELAGEERLAETVKDLDHMRRSLLETVATMDRFLHAERFRKGKVQLKPAPLKVTSFINEISSHFVYQAREKGVEIKADAAGDFTIVSDRELLVLVLQNLLSNAVKYSEKGTITVGAELAGASCKLWVKDVGPGIAADKLDHLFTAYLRGETHGQPGVGLGLSIAQQAAGFLKGELWAESEVGKGSTFYLQVPRELQAGSA